MWQAQDQAFHVKQFNNEGYHALDVVLSAGINIWRNA